MPAKATFPTEKQLATYQYIKGYIESKGYSPSIRDIMRHFGLKSPAPVQSRLEGLKIYGYINWIPKESRTIHLLNQKIIFRSIDYQAQLYKHLETLSDQSKLTVADLNATIELLPPDVLQRCSDWLKEVKEQIINLGYSANDFVKLLRCYLDK